MDNNENTIDYVSQYNINTHTHTDIEVDLHNIDNTISQLKEILSEIKTNINKILTLEEFPSYVNLNIRDYICNDENRNNNIEYMDNETVPQIGSKVTNLYINTRWRTIQTGIIVREYDDFIDAKAIDYENGNEIVLFDLEKDYPKEEKYAKHKKINSQEINEDGSMKFEKLQVKMINGCLPRTLNKGERRFIVSLLPVKKRCAFHYNKTYYFIEDELELTNIQWHYVLDKQFNIQYLLNSIDIVELLSQHNEMIPYFEKYQPINNERHNPSIKTIQLKNALFVLFEKNKKVDKMINSLPHYKIEQGTIYSSSNRTQKLKAKIMLSEL